MTKEDKSEKAQKPRICVLRRRRAIQGILSVLPAILVILAIQAYSIVTVIVKSFTNWDGLFKNSFIGLRNYTTLIQQDQFGTLLLNNLFFLLFIPVTLFAGMVVAVLLYQECIGWKFFRAIICLPQMLSYVVLGYLIKVFFSYSGPVNTALETTGLGALARDWLSQPWSARVVILFVLVWVNIGWQSMIFTGGLTAIEPSIIEAATLDGAGYWDRLFRIIFPMMLRVIEYSIITNIIFVFTGLFSIIFSITNGGPGYATTTIDYMIYLRAFVIGTDLGKACALALILLVIVSIITIIEMQVSNKLDDWS